MEKIDENASWGVFEEEPANAEVSVAEDPTVEQLEINPDKEETNTREIVTCQLGKVEFALDINSVQEIVKISNISPVPGAPAFVRGIANLRGNVLPVIDSKARFGLPPAEGQNDNERIVVTELNGCSTGLIVDSVREVMNVKKSDIEPAPRVVQGISGNFIEGILKLNDGDRLVLLLNENQIMTDEDFATLKQHSSGNVNEQRAQVHDDESNVEDDYEQIVTFRLGNEEYGISIMDVQETIRVPSISGVPNVPPGVEGTTSLRNRIIPVIDLRTMMGFPSLKNDQSDFLEIVEKYKDDYQKWFGEVENSVKLGNNFTFVGLKKSDFGRWYHSFATIDKLISELLRPIGAKHKMLHESEKNLHEAIQSGNQQSFKRQFNDDFRPSFTDFMESFDRLLKGVNEREDERCLVVNVGDNNLVALRIDAVNRVLNIQKSLIEQMPDGVGSQGHTEQMKGVVKLDDGKRLLVYLDGKKLVNSQVLEDLLDASATNALDADADAEPRRGIEMSTNDEEMQLVSFKVKDEEFAADIAYVKEIVRLDRVTKVPHSASYVAGMVNLRGKVLPVIDLRKRFNMDSTEYDDATRVVVLETAGKQVGIIVDRVSEVMRILRSQIDPPPAIIVGKFGKHFIEGVGKLREGKRTFLLLKTDMLLNDIANQDLEVKKAA